MRLWRTIFCCALLFVVCGLISCTTRSAHLATKIYYSDSHFAHLILPKFSNISIEENQQMTGSYGDKKFSGNSWMLLNDSLIHVMLFSSMGNVIAELIYTQDSVFFNSRWIDSDKVKAEYVIADVQFCYYPAKILSENFQKAGLHLRESQEGSSLRRSLSEGKSEILVMEKSKGRIRFENKIRNYRYQIESENQEERNP